MDTKMEDFILETAIFKIVKTYENKTVGMSDNKDYDENASYLQVINDAIKMSTNKDEFNQNLENSIVIIQEAEYGNGAMANFGIQRIEFLSDIEIEVILKRKTEVQEKLSKYYFSVPFAI